MAKKKLKYIEDLYEFFLNENKTAHFSSSESGDEIVVQINGKVKFDNESNSTDGLTKCHLQACHTGLNRNQSNISQEVMEAALPSFMNRPVLGYIHTVDGQPEFWSHNMHEDDDGKIVYDEICIGIVPESCNAKIVMDEGKGKSYVEVDAYLFNEYSSAVEILQREGECSVSVELSIRELSFNAKEKYLDIEDMYFSGVTILGKSPTGKKIEAGMEGANIKIADFSKENNSLFAEKIESMQEKIDLLLSRFEINNEEKGGNNLMTKFEELLAKYNKSVEDIDFEYKSLDDKQLEAIFAEKFSDTSSPVDNTETDGVDNSAITKTENMSKTFEISHDDIRYALYNLLTAYEEADDEWYYINAVYDTHFTYSNWDSTKIFGQNYVKDGDNVSLDGERYNLHMELLTDSEYAELQSMRENYASLVTYKANAEYKELHALRENVLTDEKYSVLAEKTEAGDYINARYAELYSTMDDYSVEDLEKEMKVVLGEYALNGGKFSLADDNEEPKKHPKTINFANPNKKPKTSKYGNLKFH